MDSLSNLRHASLSEYSPTKAYLPRNNQYLRYSVFRRNQLKSSVNVVVSNYISYLYQNKQIRPFYLM